MTIEEKIYSFENENTVIGIGDASPFYEIEEILKSIDTPFVEKDIKKRIDPRLTYENANSIIAMGLSYDKIFVGQNDNRLRASLSVGAMGLDYHIILRQKLEELKAYAKIEGLVFVDTGPLVDREVFKRCNLGKFAKSGNMINKKLGTIFFIGYILTNERLEPTKKQEDIDYCKDCNMCIKACPSGCIREDGYDYKNCISYLTQKKELDEKERYMIKRQLYGCDICQKVCPYNKKVLKEEISDIDIFYPDIETLLFMSNKEFEKTYKKTASGWRGKKVLQRNAIISLANRPYSKEALDLINRKEKENNEYLSQYIAWAKKRIQQNGIF